MSKVIFSGGEGSGKSYKLAEVAGRCVQKNSDYIKMGLPPRPIVSNMEFSQWFLDFAAERNVPIRYWKDIEELPQMTECDLFIDECGAYFDSRTFKDLPLDVRLWLQQADKLGVDIYGTAQDFAQIDISFRRLVKSENGGLYHITKYIGSTRPCLTKPQAKRVWGVCSMRTLDPVAYDEKSQKFSKSGIVPAFFFLRKEVCDVFDTNKRVAKSKPVPFKHILRACSDPKCCFENYQIINGVKHKVVHV